MPCKGHESWTFNYPIGQQSKRVNKLDKYCALILEFMNLLQNFLLADIEYIFCCERRAVPLQTLTKP